ncbi:MAG: SDR family oxidoreductase [gamma proteobacterium symbiont of Bathyaustriella thionipta]|nr:SDR family oxidoreductase [gamma proteobacterium symbiont of Bathyaustriella thionipta]
MSQLSRKQPLNSVLIIGCGYVGRRLASRLLAEQVSVSAIVRSEKSRDQLLAAGIEAYALDLDDTPETFVPGAHQQVFYLLPPPRSGLQDSRTQACIDCFARHGQPQKLLYLSTTGVYGDCQGNWVSEEQPLRPTAERAKRRLHAETQWLNWQQHNQTAIRIVRVAGIYGPDRLPLARLEKGLPLLKESQSPWMNRIHVDDLVSVLIAAMQSPAQARIYNASDGHPGSMNQYFNAIADRAGLPRPPQIDIREAAEQLSAGMMSYMRESRRISNRRMLAELQVRLRYANLQAGLDAIFAKSSE